MSFDDIDLKIMDLLQQNAQMTMKEIAQKVNISITPIHERIKKLEAEGLIQQYVTLLDKKKLGLNLVVFCNIALNKQSSEDFEIFNAAIKGMPEVQECNVVSGAFDYILKIVVKDMDAYYKFHQQKLANIKCVVQINSFFVMNEVKFSVSLPLNCD